MKIFWKAPQIRPWYIVGILGILDHHLIYMQIYYRAYTIAIAQSVPYSSVAPLYFAQIPTMWYKECI